MPPIRPRHTPHAPDQIALFAVRVEIIHLDEQPLGLDASELGQFAHDAAGRVRLRHRGGRGVLQRLKPEVVKAIVDRVWVVVAVQRLDQLRKKRHRADAHILISYLSVSIACPAVLSSETRMVDALKRVHFQWDVRPEAPGR